MDNFVNFSPCLVSRGASLPGTCFHHSTESSSSLALCAPKRGPAECVVSCWLFPQPEKKKNSYQLPASFIWCDAVSGWLVAPSGASGGQGAAAAALAALQGLQPLPRFLVSIGWGGLHAWSHRQGTNWNDPGGFLRFYGIGPCLLQGLLLCAGFWPSVSN